MYSEADEIEYKVILEEKQKIIDAKFEFLKGLVGVKIYKKILEFFLDDFEFFYFRAYASTLRGHGYFKKQRTYIKGFKWMYINQSCGYTEDDYSGYVALKFKKKYLIFEYVC